MSSPSPAEERRIVTVLFCDLVGSTRLAGAVDAEVFRSITLQYFAVMRAAIEGHGGTVEKFIGDAVMAVFGVPTVHEDDPRRSLAAALDLTRALAELNVRLARSPGVQLAVRIGINTGEVITAVDPAAGNGLVSGEAVSVAARLEQMAAAGEVLVGRQTVLAAGGAAVVEPVGPLQLRGKVEPVTAFRLLGVHADSPETVRRFDVPFVGRVAELAQLNLVIDRVSRHRRGHLVTVFGEPGIGKTRLLRHWLADAGVGLRVGSGRCRPYGERGTLAALADAVGALRAALRPGCATDAVGVLETGLLLDGTPNPSLAETGAALGAVLVELAAEATVVLMLDDCHWAQPELVALLDDLALPMAHLPVLLVCAARPDLLDLHPGWGRGRLDATSLSLTGLADDEAIALSNSFVEVGAHGLDANNHVLARAEGNPLFVEQLMMALYDGAADGVSEDTVPPTLQLLLASRVARLAPELRSTLELVAVVGREFGAIEVDALARAERPGPPGTADATTDMATALRGLTAARLIEPVHTRPGAGGRYRFCSALVHDVAYRAMAKRVRAARHVRCADLLGTEAIRADHLWRAHRYLEELADPGSDGVRARAAAALTVAGRTALARADLGWAADLLSRAIELVEPGTAEQAQASLSLGEVEMARGKITSGTALLGTAATVAARVGDRATTAHARLTRATFSGRSPDEVAVAAERALPVFRAAGDVLGQSRALLRLAQREQHHGRHVRALAQLEEALEHAVRAQAAPERAVVLGATGVSLCWGPEPAATATARCRELRAEHGPDRPAVRVTLSCPLAVLLALQDQADAAREEITMACRSAQDLGYAESEAFLPLFGAAVEGHSGAPEAAESLLRQAIAAGRRLQVTSVVATASVDLARLLLDGGRWIEAADLVPTTIDGLPPAESARIGGLLARIAAHRGNDDATGAARLACDHAATTDSPEVRGTAALDAAEVELVLGRPAHAAVAAAEAEFARKGHAAGLRAARRIGGRS